MKSAEITRAGSRARAAWLGIGLAAAIALGACAGSEPAATDADDVAPLGETALAGPSSAVGLGISVAEALTPAIDGPVLVNDFLVASNDEVRLCSLLAESFPPQCGGDSLSVVGLDVTARDDTTSASGVTWTDQIVQVLGSVDGDTLTADGLSLG